MLFGDAPVETVADRLGMYAGFSTARSTKDDDELVISVMVFPNAAAATKASKQMADAAKTKQADFRAATLKGYPEAHGWAGKYESIDSRYLHTFLADGPLVIYVWMSTTIKGDKYLHDIVPKVYDQQIALLKGYTPTPEAKLKEQKVDPEGLLARTLPNSPDNGTVNDGWYQASGMLHFVVNPNDDKPIFDTAGIDLVTRDGSTVYRAKDADRREVRRRRVRQGVGRLRPELQGHDRTSGPTTPGACRTRWRRSTTALPSTAGTPSRSAPIPNRTWPRRCRRRASCSPGSERPVGWVGRSNPIAVRRLDARSRSPP